MSETTYRDPATEPIPAGATPDYGFVWPGDGEHADLPKTLRAQAQAAEAAVVKAVTDAAVAGEADADRAEQAAAVAVNAVLATTYLHMGA